MFISIFVHLRLPEGGEVGPELSCVFAERMAGTRRTRSAGAAAGGQSSTGTRPRRTGSRTSVRGLAGTSPGGGRTDGTLGTEGTGSTHSSRLK